MNSFRTKEIAAQGTAARGVVERRAAGIGSGAGSRIVFEWIFWSLLGAIVLFGTPWEFPDNGKPLWEFLTQNARER